MYRAAWTPVSAERHDFHALEPWTLDCPHDLRRTAATRMAEIGISGDVIDECLNHMIESRVRRTYIRDRRLSEQRKAFDTLGARLQALTTGLVEARRGGRRLAVCELVPPWEAAGKIDRGLETASRLVRRSHRPFQLSTHRRSRA
jgi:hypothetical protein